MVVPLDGSRVSENALPYVGAVAKASGAAVRFVHVVDEDAARNDADFERAKQVFGEYVTALAKDHLPAGIEHSVATVKGAAAKEILNLAADATMIVISTHGAGGIKAAVIGSVTDKVVRGTTVPVLVIPGTDEAADQPSKKAVLIAVDGSPEAEQGLVKGREFATWLGAPVVLVRSYSIPVPVGTEFVYYPADQAEIFEKAAKDYVAGAAKATEKSYVVHGPAAQSIEDTAEELDAQAVVVSSHGKGFAARIALGSTTDRLMHSMKRPLLVVPVKS